MNCTSAGLWNWLEISDGDVRRQSLAKLENCNIVIFHGLASKFGMDELIAYEMLLQTATKRQVLHRNIYTQFIAITSTNSANSQMLPFLLLNFSTKYEYIETEYSVYAMQN